MSDLLIVAPLLVEALAIRSAAPDLHVRTTGMGPERARAAVPALSADPARAMLVLGFGGGLRSDSRLCEVVVAEQVVTVDEHGSPSGEAISCDGTEPLAAALVECRLEVRRGVVASVDRIITGEAREQMQACGALAVDMESAWIAAAARGRPLAVVRVLSDTSDRELRQRLPVGPPLPTLADAARATAALRRAAKAIGTLSRQNRLHTVFGSLDDRTASKEVAVDGGSS